MSLRDENFEATLRNVRPLMAEMIDSPDLYLPLSKVSINQLSEMYMHLSTLASQIDHEIVHRMRQEPMDMA